MKNPVEIFVADDDMEDRMIIFDLLKDISGPERVHLSEDGVGLIDSLQHTFQTGQLPCLAILDLNMPKMNGIETLKEIRGIPSLANLPVIVLSTSVNELQRKECMSLGASHYLTKPCTYKESLQLGAFIREISETIV